jgi:methyl-accepting chemotaxis protein
MKIGFPTKFHIGAKLGACVGAGIVLVAGMIASEQISSNSVERLVAAADQQQDIVNESIGTKVVLQAAQITGRDIRKARSMEQVGKLNTELSRIAQDARARLDRLSALTASPEAQTQFQEIADLTLRYISALGDVGTRQTEILGNFAELDQVESKWNRGIILLTSSSSFELQSNVRNMEVLINEAASAFKDARTATWRYFVLAEPSQSQRIAVATEQAVQKLNFARRDAADKTLLGEIDKLAALVPEYTAFLKATTDAIDAQNQIQSDRADQAESAARTSLERAIATAARLSDAATVEAAAGARRAGHTRIIVGAFVALVLLGTAVFASLAVGRPIRRIGEVLMELAAGNKTVKIPYTNRSDEIGDTARVADIFRDSMARMEQIEAEQKHGEERLKAERRAEMHRLADTFEATVGGIVDTVSSTSAELETAAATLARTAESTQGLTVVLSASAQQASSNVQTVSQAADEISASASEINRQVQESSEIAQQAVQQAERTDVRMSELTAAAGRIGAVVKLISSIAAQTNLLALNATIEAARAGDAGRGFAVVASEVKTLAQRTAEATTEIGEQISGIQTATQDSVTALQEIGATILRLSEIASSVAASVEAQDVTAEQISSSVKQAARGTSQVAASISDVNKEASNTGSASSRVLSSAQGLAAQSHKLRIEADKFLETVRAS